MINFVISVVKQKSLNYSSKFDRGKSSRWSLYLDSYRFRWSCPFDYFSISVKVPRFRTIESLVLLLIIIYIGSHSFHFCFCVPSQSNSWPAYLRLHIDSYTIYLLFLIVYFWFQAKHTVDFAAETWMLSLLQLF